MHKTFLIAVAVFLIPIAGAAPTARAIPRFVAADADVVQRSELIVIGAVKEKSMVRVDFPQKADGGEYHATLLIQRILKGKCDQQEIPIVLHNGISPRERYNRLGTAVPGPPAIADGWEDEIIVGNAQADNVWLLRTRGSIYPKGSPVGETSDLGIADPEDLRPPALEQYLTCYLAADPESAMRKYLSAHTEATVEAYRYLEQIEIARLTQIADPAMRVERLLPYFVANSVRFAGYDAKKGIVSAGEVAGPYLSAVYKSTTNSHLHQDIINVWGEIRWPGCVDELCTLLKRRDAYWADQKLSHGWWNNDVESELTRNRRDIYCEVYDAVHALSQINDHRATEAILLTRRRWAQVDIENKQIVEECDAALKRFDDSAKDSTIKRR